MTITQQIFLFALVFVAVVIFEMAIERNKKTRRDGK